MKKEASLLPYALLLNVVYVGIFGLAHYFLGSNLHLYSVVYDNVLLWVLLFVSIQVVSLLCKAFRWSDDATVPLVINVLVVIVLLWLSALLLAWYTQVSVEPLGTWQRGFLNVLGFLYVYLMFAVVTSFYTGSIFKLVGLGVALLSYLVFAFFPALTSNLVAAIF
jgi:hypothetical protein